MPVKHNEIITIVGFGSLLSEDSARQTCPTLQNFRPGCVNGYARVFGKVDPNCERFDHPEIANWAFFEKPDAETLVTLFEIGREDYPAFAMREAEYNLRLVNYRDAEHDKTRQGVACIAFDHNRDFIKYLKDHPIQHDRYYSRVHKKYEGPIWRNDILPRPYYLAFCLNAARHLGQHYVDNILDHGYLADRMTTLRHYIGENFDNLQFINELDWLKEAVYQNVTV